VPGSFTSVAACEASVSFRYKKKFDKFDLLEIFNKANIYKDNIGFRAINRSPIYYLLNDEIKTMDPIGKVGTKLTGLISYTYADVNYLNKMAKILKEIGITKTEFVSNCLAESWFLFDAKMRDNYIILIDVGYICTNIMLIYGDGIVFLKSFAIGSGHISADLCEMLNMDYKSAEELISKINLNLEFDIEDTYKLSKGLSVNAEKANNIVKARIEDIADYLNRCMQLCPYVIDSNTPVYLTGGGLTYIKGGAQCLSVMLDKTVKTAISNNPLTNNPQHSTAYGLMDIAFKQKNN
jgi:cell division protein FtsA